MPFKIGNIVIDENTVDLKIGSDLIGGIKIGNTVVYEWQPPRVTFSWSGVLTKSGGNIINPTTNSRLPSEWIEGGAAAYLRPGQPILVGSSGNIRLHLVPSAGSTSVARGPQLTSDAETNLRIEFTHATAGTLTITGTGSDTDEPYDWTPSNAAEVRTWVSAVSNGDQVTVTFSLAGSITPPAPSGITVTLVTANGGFNGPNRRGSVTPNAFTPPGRAQVTFLHLRRVGAGVNFALTGTRVAADFPTRFTAEFGGTTLTFTPRSGTTPRSISGGTRLDYDPTTGAVGDVFANQRTINVELFYG